MSRPAARVLPLALALALAACGAAGPPLPPPGAVAPVAAQGTALTPEKGAI